MSCRGIATAQRDGDGWTAHSIDPSARNTMAASCRVRASREPTLGLVDPAALAMLICSLPTHMGWAARLSTVRARPTIPPEDVGGPDARSQSRSLGPRRANGETGSQIRTAPREVVL